MALPDQRNGFNASPGICPALFHPCSTLFHQFGATRLAYGPKRPFLAVLDPVWPYNWPKWLEQEWCLVEQVNPYQNEAENIIGCHGKPTSKKPPSLTHCAYLALSRLPSLLVQLTTTVEPRSPALPQPAGMGAGPQAGSQVTLTRDGTVLFCKWLRGGF